MKVLFLSSEVSPFAKTGGLADVSSALPTALTRRGIEVAVFMPEYRCATQSGIKIESTGLEILVPLGDKTLSCKVNKALIPKSKVPLYLVDYPPFFDREGLYQEKGRDYPDNLERFVLYNKAVLLAVQKLGFRPDIIHANDWQTSLVPVYLKTQYLTNSFFKQTKTLLTIHNLAYQGSFPKGKFPLTGLDWSLFSIEGLEFYDYVNLLKGGLLFSDCLTTVSKHYCEDIQKEESGCGLDGVLKIRRKVLSGILNGVDYKIWNPEIDSLIPANYSVKDLSGKAICKASLQKAYGLPLEPNVPLLGMVSRLVDQKGVSLIADIADYLMAFKVQLVFLGIGDPEYQRIFEEISKRYPSQFVTIFRFDNPIAHEIEAGADLFLMPSRHEPCGLNQMYSLKYGTIPVVRATGGLADTIREYDPITHQGNGFLFEELNPIEFFRAIQRGLVLYSDKEAWATLMRRAMTMDFSWNRSAGLYIDLYRKMLQSVPKQEVERIQ